MKILLLVCIFFSISSVFSQDRLDWLKENKTDSLYREDQFYVGFSFNFLSNLPSDVDQSGFSGGLVFGFIRDMPVNKRRNLSLGLGLGLSLNTFGQTLQISRQGDTDVFEPISEETTYDSNRFTTNLVQIPFELRWRSSDVGKLSFWRVYFGVNFGYVLGTRSVFKSPEESFSFTSIEGINNFTTSAKLTFGYGAVNFFADLSLIPIFDGQIESTGEKVSIRPIKVGLVFFFL